MSLERIFEALVTLGLSEPDARVYIYLALKGPKRPNDIVKSLKINRQKILQSLKSLQEKEIIFANQESKEMFSTLPFDKILKLLIKTQKEQITILQENLVSNWKAIMEKSQNENLINKRIRKKSN